MVSKVGVVANRISPAAPHRTSVGNSLRSRPKNRHVRRMSKRRYRGQGK